MSENNGYSLGKAPNGAESKLFKDFLDNFNGNRVEAIKAKAKIYSDSFKKWFGDWEKGLHIVQDNNLYYRGQYEEPIIDKDGNLILKGKQDQLYKDAGYDIDKGVSATTDMGLAIDYGSNQRYAYESDIEDKYGEMDQSWEKQHELEEILEHGYYLIQFPKSVSNQVIKEGEEVKLIGDVVIPKGSYTIEHITEDRTNVIAVANSNASKVVDENGEHLVVYHGSPKKNIFIFNTNKVGSYFSNNKDFADAYQGIFSGKTYYVFLNLKNPLIIDGNNTSWTNLDIDKVAQSVNLPISELKNIVKYQDNTPIFKDLLYTLKEIFGKQTNRDYGYAV